MWRDDIKTLEKVLTVGSVYVLTNFSIDKYPLDTNNTKPKDIHIRFSTSIRKLEDGEIQQNLIDLALPKEIAGTNGTIKFITNIYEYMAYFALS